MLVKRFPALVFLLFSFSCFAQQPKDFSFLTGSCAHLDRTLEDSTGIYYKGDTSIFYSMSQTPSDFLLWLGDNWYLDAGEWTTSEGLKYKAEHNRNANVMKRLRQRGIPEYAIWDDHDYGYNNANKIYPLKKESRQVFIDTWPDNPSYGENGEGIYTSFRYQDVLFILLDDRWWRDDDRKWAYRWFIKPNPNKLMFGRQQMDWLKRTLLEDTTASFKIIVNGSQVLNPLAKGDCLVHFPVEYGELLEFIDANKISGVLFLSGDRHFSEIIELKRKNYPLFDITVSPFTSDIDRPRGRERRNFFRIPGTLLLTKNFAQVSISGVKDNRKLEVRFFDNRGKKLLDWKVSSVQLKAK